MSNWWGKLGTVLKVIIVILGFIFLTNILPELISLIFSSSWGLFAIFAILALAGLVFWIIAIFSGPSTSSDSSNSYSGGSSSYSGGSSSYSGGSSSYSGGSSSYSGGSSSSSGSSDSTFSENDLVEAIADTLHSKSTSAVAIYHSPFVSQWYLVNYWGQKEYVSYERTGYGQPDYFETRDGKRYIINDSIPNREKIYYFS